MRARDGTPNYGMRVKGGNGNLVGATPFLIAAQSNDVAIMRELVAHGADPNLATNHGTTPLMVAAGIGHLPGMSRSTEPNALEAVKLCLELGADVNAANKTRDTALHGAAWRQFADSIVQFLVDHGANMDAKNKRGWTPLVDRRGHPYGGKFRFLTEHDRVAAEIGSRSQPAGYLESTRSRRRGALKRLVSDNIRSSPHADGHQRRHRNRPLMPTSIKHAPPQKVAPRAVSRCHVASAGSLAKAEALRERGRAAYSIVKTAACRQRDRRPASRRPSTDAGAPPHDHRLVILRACARPHRRSTQFFRIE